jgi:hypothetical protein
MGLQFRQAVVPVRVVLLVALVLVLLTDVLVSVVLLVPVVLVLLAVVVVVVWPPQMCLITGDAAQLGSPALEKYTMSKSVL